jgi:hypothetical protein
MRPAASRISSRLKYGESPRFPLVDWRGSFPHYHSPRQAVLNSRLGRYELGTTLTAQALDLRPPQTAISSQESQNTSNVSNSDQDLPLFCAPTWENLFPQQFRGDFRERELPRSKKKSLTSPEQQRGASRQQQQRGRGLGDCGHPKTDAAALGRGRTGPPA